MRRHALALLAAAGCGRFGFDRSDAARSTATCAVNGCEGSGCDDVDPLVMGLIGWWSFDDGIGSVARDSSGNDRNGVIVGAPTSTIGHEGLALDFDGVDDQVSLSTEPSLDLRFPMTLTAWVRPGALTSAARHSIVGRDEKTPANVRSFEWGVDLNGSVSLTTYPGCVTAGQLYSYGGEIGIGVWSHLAMSIASDGTIEHYIDGSHVTTEPIATATCDMQATTFLGGTPYGPYLWVGALDEIRIYDRALDACVVEAVHCHGIWHCSNGRTDCGETAVDTGADC